MKDAVLVLGADLLLRTRSARPVGTESHDKRSNKVRLVHLQGRESLRVFEPAFENARTAFFVTFEGGALSGLALLR
jgi:hypothetical protein